MKQIFASATIAILLSHAVYAGELKAIHQQKHLDALSVYKKNADDYVAKNLNRFGLNQLLNYDAALDTMYKAEMEDTVTAFKSSYDVSHRTRSNTISSLNDQIRDLSAKKEKAKNSFSGLLRKAAIASLIWLGIVILLIQIRTRALKRVMSRLDTSKGQLEESVKRMNGGKEMLKLAHEKQNNVNRIADSTRELPKLISETVLTEEAAFTKAEADKLKAAVLEIIRASGSSHKIVSTLLTQEASAGAEKTNTNLNLLCDQCFDLVYGGMKSNDPDFKISVSKDLEKNLPQISVVPEAVTQLLINVLVNAFQSVKERQEKKIAGYAAKVTISTRVLPRFLQVRVHDNGEGMTDDIIQRVTEPYFTMKTSSNASGMGMHFAKKIASEMHQGELKIESEPGTKTDVYLKFFTT